MPEWDMAHLLLSYGLKDAQCLGGEGNEFDEHRKNDVKSDLRVGSCVLGSAIYWL